MRLLKKQHLACVVLFIFSFMIIGWGVSAFRKHVQAEHAFAFVRDLAAFSISQGRLPSSIEQFCLWKLDAKGRPIWDADITAKKFRFLWLSPEFAISDSQHYLAVIDPSIKKYESALNEQIVGRIPSNILIRTVVP